MKERIDILSLSTPSHSCAYLFSISFLIDAVISQIVSTCLNQHDPPTHIVQSHFPLDTGYLEEQQCQIIDTVFTTGHE
jgi:hypothetical protein